MGWVGKLLKSATLGSPEKGGIAWASGSLAKLQVPGKATVDLSAGEATLYYQEERSNFNASGDENIDFRPAADLSVSVRTRGGDEVPVEGTRQHEQFAEGVRIRGSKARAKFARCKLGTVLIPADGSYELEASATLDSECSRAQLLVDGPDRTDSGRSFSLKDAATDVLKPW